jgi:hypothetical protein
MLNVSIPFVVYCVTFHHICILSTVITMFYIQGFSKKIPITLILTPQCRKTLFYFWLFRSYGTRKRARSVVCTVHKFWEGSNKPKWVGIWLIGWKWGPWCCLIPGHTMIHRFPLDRPIDFNLSGWCGTVLIMKSTVQLGTPRGRYDEYSSKVFPQ